jgi:hypothetical protein
MGCTNSVLPTNENESEGSRVDRELLETTCGIFHKKKAQIAIQNSSGRALYAVVMDDNNAQKVKQIRAGVGIGADGVSGDAEFIWGFANVNIERRLLLQDRKTVFDIIGDCGYIWISDRIDFPVMATPYNSTRVPKGHVQTITEDVFLVSYQEVPATTENETTKKYRAFLDKPLAACSLLEVPGIGPANSGKLKAAGCDSAAGLMERYVAGCHGSTEEMVAWLTSTCKIQGRYAAEAARALQAKRVADGGR